MPVVIQRGPKPQVLVSLTPEEVRDLLLSLPDNKRIFIISDPKLGQHKVISIRRNVSNNVEYDYEKVPE